MISTSRVCPPLTTSPMAGSTARPAAKKGESRCPSRWFTLRNGLAQPERQALGGGGAGHERRGQAGPAGGGDHI